ncbi:MAG: ArnT family glycosyltransferase, partial [Blastocatellia bacterium]
MKRTFHPVFLAVFLLGAALRTGSLLRPMDQPSWREADVLAVARAYHEEGMNLLYPRIDWRGSGPGYAEMEFPLYPWLIACAYRLFGVNELYGRFLACLFSILALWVFIRLARYVASETTALIAGMFFALNPLPTFMGTAIQPEPLMFLCYIAAAYAFIRWLDSRSVGNESAKYYWLAVIWTALAILAKATAAHIGLFFAALILGAQGLSVLRDRRVWIFGVLAVAPGMLWYLHAHNLWLTYGNSLGVSNESHLAGPDLFTNQYFIRGILKQEINWVWTLPGAAVAIFGLSRNRQAREVRYSFPWLLAAGFYYLAIARTSADGWAFYYHLPTVAPAALLFGAGIEAITQMSLPFQNIPARLETW